MVKSHTTGKKTGIIPPTTPIATKICVAGDFMLGS
jgi:hypothetical protein